MDSLQLLLDIFTGYGYLAVFGVLLLCGFGVPIPEDITLVAGGIISGLDYTNVHAMFVVCMVGVVLGDGIMFTVGHVYGERVMSVPLIARILTPKRFANVQEKFARYGNWVLFVARFLPGLRSPIFITAGMTRRVPYWRFILMDGFAALISVPIWVYLGYFGAANHEWLRLWIHRGQTGLLTALCMIVAVLLVLYYYRKHRQRRLQSQLPTRDSTSE